MCLEKKGVMCMCHTPRLDGSGLRNAKIGWGVPLHGYRAIGVGGVVCGVASYQRLCLGPIWRRPRCAGWSGGAILHIAAGEWWYWCGEPGWSGGAGFDILRGKTDMCEVYQMCYYSFSINT